MKAWPILGISIVQLILLVAHWFLLFTATHFWKGLSPLGFQALRAALLFLAFSFVVASMLGFRFHGWLISIMYTLASVWLGLLNYLFWAACLCWPAWYLLFAVHGATPTTVRPVIADVLLVTAVLTAIYGLGNARFVRLRRISLRLPGLPETWRGRRAVMLSDLHLGNVNAARFAQRMVAMVQAEKPDIVFIPGDLFDGTCADLDALIAPLRNLKPTFGTYFSTGNHEEFRDVRQYLNAIERAGVHVLENRLVTIDGLQIGGVSFGDASNPVILKTVLEAMQLDTNRASILLNHMPSRLPIVERAGFQLQLSGHTHGGQFAPFNWITHRIFGKFTHGLHSFGELQVYTSTGAGTWGPPMRAGTDPEIVSIDFI